jgi:hypothetical protein
MRRHWTALGTGAVVLVATIGMSPPAAATPGPDLRVSVQGNFPTGPDAGGNIGVTWTNVGTANATGVTHVTVDFPVGLMTTGGYMTGSTVVYTQTPSPDGRHEDIVFFGTIAPSASLSMKLFVGSTAAWQPGTVTATVANAADTNTANNQTAVTHTGGQLPAPPPQAAPTVTIVSPAGGPAAGGTTMHVTGTELTNGLVMFGGTPATDIACTATSCAATSPAGAGTVDVTLLTPGGVSAPTPFTYDGTPPPAPAPTVTHLNPMNGQEPGGTGVTVLGTNLALGTVRFGGAEGVNTSCGPTQCSSTAPPGTGTVNVTVTTAGGTSAVNPTGWFTYQGPTSPPAPVWTATTPTSGSTGGGTTVTITGTNLTQARVGFGTSPAASTTCTATTCTATTPPGSGSGLIRLNTAGGTIVAGVFAWQDQPAATVTPTSIAYGSQRVGTTSSPRTVTLTNTGAAPLTISKVQLGGTNPGQFARSSACPANLAPGASCQVTVTFKPTSRGDKSATLSLTNNAPGSPHKVTLTGRGS